MTRLQILKTRHLRARPNALDLGTLNTLTVKFLLPFPILLCLFLTGCESSPDRSSAAEEERLPPTEFIEEGEENHAARERWIEQIHRAAPGTDWRRLEAINAMTHHKLRAGGPREKGTETFAGGQLTGEWSELGSSTQAGSVFDVLQDPDDLNTLFLMSAGGAIWKHDLAGSTYELVTHDIYFDGEYLGMVPTPAGRNMIAYAGDWPMFSEDDGRSWSDATLNYDGQPRERFGNVQFYSPIVVGSVLYTTIRPGDGMPHLLFRSTDGGRSYELVASPLDRGEEDYYSVGDLFRVDRTGQVFLVTKIEGGAAAARLYEMNADETFRLVAERESEQVGRYRSRIAATPDPENGDSLRMYWLIDDYIWRSDNDGVNWDTLPQLDELPWRYEGIYVRPTEPDFVAYGNVSLWVSSDGGHNFKRPNEWWQYYDDPATFIHADIMRFTEIDLPEGGTAMLASNHGGLNRLNTTDSLWYSIAREGLNVGQYYDIRTNPTDATRVYLGAQDQGLQVINVPLEGAESPLPGTQFNSGDWGHLEFSDDGQLLFAAYPYGLLRIFYDDGEDVYRDGSYRIKSNDEFIWITPMMSPPVSRRASPTVYMAGGSAEEDGDGSFLIRIEYNEDIFETTAENLPYDFIANGHGNISALGYSPLAPDRFYAATTFGHFLTSEDAGQTWSASNSFVPRGWYLYGQAIHASRTEENTVWLGGSGYSNDPVWRSTDGGVNFEPASTGLPPTIVHGLAANADETLLFAATEAGPFVYVAADERWYDLTGRFAPTMRYYSVEFVDELNTARFGTYGRGGWDFRIESLVGTRSPLANEPLLEIFPNPTADRVTVSGDVAGLRAFDGRGREVLRQSMTGTTTELDLGRLAAGVYFFQPLDDAGRPTALAQRVVKK